MTASLSVATLIELGNRLRLANIQLCFSGPFTTGIIQHFGAALRTYLERGQSNASEVTGVFSVYIEMAQNIQRYTTRHYEALASAGVGASNGIIVIGRNERRTLLVAGNWVLRPSLDPLIARVQELRSLDEAALKARYKQQLRAAPSDSEEDGAGMGLITIARHASAPIECEHVEHPQGLAFFSLSAEV
ncbi:MAG: SiaB family protein kinase [Myxococcales bacterium]|nr:SiaB family protein kinase [Myxococcales bacterium]